MAEPNADLALVQGALAGQPADLQSLLARLIPVIQARAARTLMSHGRRSQLRNIQQETEDLVQEVLLVCFDQDGRVLRAWNPGRGMSLENYIGMVTQNRTIDVLRSGKRNPWFEEPVFDEDLARLLAATPSAEGAVGARDKLERVLEALRNTLSEQGQEMLELVLIEDLSNAEIEARTGLSLQAIYKWRSRLKQGIREQAERFLSEPPAPDRTTGHRTPT